jgi:hypothetical protein
MNFDARSARALSRRIHSVHDCLSVMKQAIVQAAQAGEFEATVPLSESLPVVAGQSTNTAAFTIDFLQRNDREAWAEAATQAMRAGYALRPSWGRAATGAALEGLTLAWRTIEIDTSFARGSQSATLPSLLMPAAHALQMAEAQESHVRWVEARRTAIQLAAQRGKLSVSIDDAAAVDAPAWSHRREILHRGGFSTELIPREAGATLVVSW